MSNQNELNKQKYNPESRWFGRSLENYKTMQKGVAANKGVSDQLKAATTLTQARKVLYGLKRGQVK